MMDEQKEREAFDRYFEVQGNYSSAWDGWLTRAEIAEADRRDADLALDLLEDIYSRYEDGIQCYEVPDNYEGYVGQAIRLPSDVEGLITDLLNRRRPRNAAMKEAK
ncbi:MAG: hypothetical protein KGL39_39350 [Patescibacteria group bacterium]|nr:hypothetical protein [Patescibacteria group bacterium]